MSFAKRVLSPLDRLSGDLLGNAEMRKLIGASTQGSRFLLMDGGGDVRTFGRWIADDGVMFSNDNWRRRAQPSSYWLPDQFGLGDQMRLFEAYEVFGGRTDDPSLYGLYKPCGGCDFMEECAESLPYCPDEEAAEAMASAAWQSGC